MQTKLLIGWPSASGLGTWETIARGCIARGESVSRVVLSGSSDNLGDITGAGGARARAARVVGAGADEAMARAARAELDWERSGWVAELLRGELDLGRAIMLLAGGREFLAGVGVRVGGAGMAARCARYIVARRGRAPSDTSLDDAAAAAAAAIVGAVCQWNDDWAGGTFYDGGAPVKLAGFAMTAARIREDRSVRRNLAGIGWRAAFASLDDDGAGAGLSGRHAREQVETVSLALTAGQIESQRASLEAWARGERAVSDDSESEQRRALCSWVWRSLVAAGPARGANEARAREGARRRAKFLIRLIHGAAWADAARLAGFEDGAAAAKVLGAGGTIHPPGIGGA